MKKIRFYLNSGYVGAQREEIFEFEDDVTMDEIQEAFDTWLTNFDMGWLEVED